MVSRIAWLDTAIKQYRRITFYMFEHHAEATIDRFDADIDRKLGRLEKQPFSGHPSQIDGIRYVIIRKRWHLYYQFSGRRLFEECYLPLRDARRR